MQDLKARWLDTQGGRTRADVYSDDKGEYVWMVAPAGYEKVYIPSPEALEYIFKVVHS